MHPKVDGWEELWKQKRHRLKTPETNESTHIGERKLIRTYRKMEPITTLYCEFKKLIKYQYAACTKWLWAWMQMRCQQAKRLSYANLCQKIRWPWWSLYFSRKLSWDKLLEDDLANLNWATTLTVWKFHHRTLFKSQAQRGSQL